MIAPEGNATRARRITLVTDEFRGSRPVGGIGTGTTFLALGLARMGHDVEILHFGTPATRAIDPEWRRIYERARIRIRFVPETDEVVEPRYFARLPETARALQAERADIVIAQDTTAPAYIALRLRQCGLAFENTTFVVVCYGTRLWMKDVARNVRVFPYLLGVHALEGASIELADVVVSPSRYVIRWMREQGWRLPHQTAVIPYLSRSAATGERQSGAATTNGRIERLAFFGRLEERKGLKPFAAGLNKVEPMLLANIELEFLGAETAAWPPDRIRSLLSESTRDALSGISFATGLDQPQALERLRRPGTLAVMPSLGETFGNVVYECLEHGIPFIASNAGATPELIAQDDHRRVLFEPTADGVAAALRRALAGDRALRVARPAFDANDAYAQWEELIATVQSDRRPFSEARPRVDVVVARRGSETDLRRCLAALERQTYTATNVIVADSRDDAPGDAPFVVLLAADDAPAPDFIDSLVRAQTASGADVVTCGLRLEDPPRQHLFLGNPGALGLLSNSYGGAALIRRALLADCVTDPRTNGDADWPILARLHLTGATIVSIPIALLERRQSPGSIDRDPVDALVVAERHEQALPKSLRPLARLAAGLAATTASPSSPPAAGLVRRAARRIRRRLVP